MMHILSNWFLAVTLAYIILGSALKGRASLIGQFIYCWGAAAVLSVSTWQLQHSMAANEAQMDPDNPYTAVIVKQHNQGLWYLFVGIIVLLLLPLILYYFDQRKQRRAALSATTV